MKTLLRYALFPILVLQSAVAQIAISDLPAATAVATGALVPIVDLTESTPANRTKKATVSQLVEGLPDATSGAAGKMSAADKAKLDNATASGTPSTLVLRDSSGNATFNSLALTLGTISSAPTNPTDIANKAYVDAGAAGLTVKTPAAAATTGYNITLSGGAPNALDGVTLALNSRVLVKDQTDNKENGIYYVSTLGSGSNGTWTRATDADTGAELPTGSYVFVGGGTANGNSAWTMVTTGTITIGVSPIVWTLFSQTTSVNASSITGQILAAQIADAQINTAKFATGLTPVEIVATLPLTNLFQGRTVFLTSDSKLYRYNGSAWTAAIAAVDVTGQLTSDQIAGLAAAKLTTQITATQITDGAITTPKLSAGSVTTAKIFAGAVTADQLSANAVTADKIAANSVTAGKILAGSIGTDQLAANAVTAGKIQAGAVSTDQLAANAVNASKIAAGAVDAGKINVASLSAISANLGTVTAGTITATTSLDVGTSYNRITINTSGLSVGTGKIVMGQGNGSAITLYGADMQAGATLNIYSPPTGSNLSPAISFNPGTGATLTITQAGIHLIGTTNVTLDTGSYIYGPGKIKSIPHEANSVNFEVGEYTTVGAQIGYIGLIVNGRAVKIPFYAE